MVNLINRSKDDVPVIINIFDVEYNATEDDVRKVYPEIKIGEITAPKKGIFLLELSKDEALKIVDLGARIINQRQFYMKMGYATKPNYDDQYHDNNKGRNRNDTGYRENKPGKKPYSNRRDNYEEDISPGFKRPYENKGYQKKPREPQQENSNQGVDPNDKYFKNHNPEQKEFNIRFTRTVSKEEAKANEPKPEPQPELAKTVSKEETKVEEVIKLENQSSVVSNGSYPDTPLNTPVEVKQQGDADDGQDPKFKKQNSKRSDDGNRYDNRGGKYGGKGGKNNKGGDYVVYQAKPQEKKVEQQPAPEKKEPQQPPKQNAQPQKDAGNKKNQSSNKKNPFDMLI